MSDPVCPLCGSKRFEDYRGVARTRCKSCKSNERTRVVKMFLDHYVKLKPGQRVLHFAPEISLGRHVAELVGAGYEAVDIAPERYADTLGHPVHAFDLCRDAEGLAAECYDLVLHNHVLEHLPCNVTLALLRLHRAVKHGGAHLFSIPISAGHSAEDLAPALTEADRVARFGQGDHMRRFGRDDFALTIGAVFGLTAAYSLTDFFPEADLRRANVRQSQWICSGSSVIYVRKPAGAPDAAAR